jgi:hypothetical protein
MDSGAGDDLDETTGGVVVDISVLFIGLLSFILVHFRVIVKVRAESEFRRIRSNE